MADPVTTPEAVLGLVAALEEASANLRRRADYIWNHVDAPGALGSASGLRGEADKLDVALAAWRERIPLRQSQPAVFSMEEVVYRCAGFSSVSTDFSGQILDAFDALLFSEVDARLSGEDD